MRPCLVPTSWFLTTSPGCSALALQAYCILLPTMGFIASRLAVGVEANLAAHEELPSRCVSDPSKNTTGRQPYRVTAAVAPLAFLLCWETPPLPLPVKGLSS